MVQISGPASSAIVTTSQILGTSLGGPFGGAAAGFITSGALSLFGGGRADSYGGFATKAELNEYQRQLKEKWLNDHRPVLSSEQERLVQGGTTRTSSFRQALPPRRRVYGTVSGGASLILHEVKNPYTYVGYALSDGPIDAVTHISIAGGQHALAATGDKLADEAVYSAFILTLGMDVGTDTQLADALLTSTTGIGPLGKLPTYRQLGAARIFARLHYGNDPNAAGAGTGLVAHNRLLWAGKTVFEFTIRGLLVDDFAGAASFSSNPARCLFDLLQCDWPGRISSGDIDIASFQAAAADFDTSGFTLNGIVYSDDSASTQISSILVACDAALVRPDGKYKLIADKPSASVVTITDSDIILPVSYSPDQALEDAPNVIRATFGGSAGEVLVEDAARLATEPERQIEVNFDNVTGSQHAENLARRLLKKLARPTLPIVISDIASMLCVFDVVTVQSAAFPECDGEYKILSIDQEIVGASLFLRRYEQNDYV